MLAHMTAADGPLARLMEWDSLVSLGTIFFLLLLSGFFSGSETALTAASPARLHRFKSEGSAAAGRALQLIDNRERLIGGILLGNNLVNILASAIATSLFLRIFGEAGVAIATGVMTLLVLIFAEVLPKTYAILHTNHMAMAVSLPLRIFVTLLAPFVHVVQMLVRATLRLFGARIDAHNPVLAVHEELRDTLDLHDQMRSEAGGNGEATQNQEPAEDGETKDLTMVGAVLDLRDLEVSEVMIHRKSIKMVNAAQPPEVIVDEVLKAPHTRVPLYRDDWENIVGILHVKDLLREMARVNWRAEDVDFQDIMREPWFIPDTTGLQAQLDAFLDRGEHFALVVDEYGTLMGLITLEDIIEEIVGDIQDEHDEKVTGVRRQPDGSYNVDGWVPIRDLNRSLNWRLPDEEATTIAGLVIHEARMIPTTGQIFTFYDFTFEVLRRWRNQITALRIIPPAHLRNNTPSRPIHPTNAPK
ncbi:MAG: HlyC/CorC family transporter [Alphaproteobacteria bacterium]